MLNCTEDDLLRLFEHIHGPMTGATYAEVVLDEEGDPEGVACMKHGHECWRATLSELAVDADRLHAHVAGEGFHHLHAIVLAQPQWWSDEMDDACKHG